MAKLRGTVLADGLSGSAGPVVFVRLPGGGTAIRERPAPSDPRSPRQRAWRALVRRAGELWRSLEPAQAEAWRAQAARAAEERRRLGLDGGPNGSGLFTALTTKIWQIDPAAQPPLWPPEQAFTGDGIELEAEGRPGRVRFAASGPNAPGVVTELLLQRLPSRVARPQAGRDRHAGFAAFAPGALEAEVGAAPGFYAASARFVRAATGQTSPLVRLAVVEVGPDSRHSDAPPAGRSGRGRPVIKNRPGKSPDPGV